MSSKKYLPTLFLFLPKLSRPFQKVKVGKKNSGDRAKPKAPKLAHIFA
jgi:hypothetical protein